MITPNVDVYITLLPQSSGIFVDNSTPMSPWAAEIGIGRLFSKGKNKEDMKLQGGKVGGGSGKELLRRNGEEDHQNTLHEVLKELVKI